MEVVFEVRYKAVMKKLVETKNRHDYWSNVWTQLCYERYLEKQK
jgi:hypothetical protein